MFNNSTWVNTKYSVYYLFCNICHLQKRNVKQKEFECSCLHLTVSISYPREVPFGNRNIRNIILRFTKLNSQRQRVWTHERSASQQTWNINRNFAVYSWLFPFNVISTRSGAWYLRHWKYNILLISQRQRVCSPVHVYCLLSCFFASSTPFSCHLLMLSFGTIKVNNVMVKLSLM